jgi:hypothetical protein
MKRKHRWFFLLLPVLIWVVAIAAYLFQSTRKADDLHPVDGLTYGSGDGLLRVELSRSIENEVSTDVITAKDVNDEIVFRNAIQIDHDLYGVGIVNAMQMDSDPELEIIGWGSNVRSGKSFILDYVNGEIQSRDYEEAPDKVKSFVDQYQSNTGGFMVYFGLLVLATPLYYFIYFLAWLFGRLFGKRAESTES